MAERANFWSDNANILGLLGSFSTGVGAYQSAAAQRSQMYFEADMSDFNARQFERAASDALRAGRILQGQVGLKAGKVRSSQRANQGARGVVISAGSAAEELATTDMMKEIDMYQIESNTVRQANELRMKQANAENQAMMARASASSSSPLITGITSFLGEALPVASSWYRRERD